MKIMAYYLRLISESSRWQKMSTDLREGAAEMWHYWVRRRRAGKR